MSDFQAIATITATLRHSLEAAIGADVAGATVTTVRPDGTGTGTPTTGVNLFLYQVTPNSAWRNTDLPTRRTNGQLVQRPRVALDLHYLLNFYGNETQLEPQRILGSVVRTLHAQPLLTRQMIQDTITDATFNFLATSNLADEIELVKFTPLPHSLEELSKLWSVFFQMPYVLSVAYQASVALIEEPVDAVRPPLPVREPRIFVQPFRRMQITSVESSEGPDAPIHADSTIRILGSELGGGNVGVNIGHETTVPTEQTARGITLDLTTLTNLQAGILTLCVVQHVSENAPQLRFESNVVPLTVSPRILSVGFTPAIADDPATPDVDESVAATVDMELIPPVVIGQRVRLFLNELLEVNAPPNAETLAYVIDAEPADEATEELSIPVSNVEPGTYLVRVQIDGAESALEVDADEDSETFDRYIGPTVVVL